MTAEVKTSSPIRVGVSSCLLGQEVRYDGGHKYSGYIVETLGRYFQFVPFCPEMAVGLGVPRPPIQLVAEAQGMRAVGTRDRGLDVTDGLTEYGRAVAAKGGHLSGYLLKKGSPSCGMERVKVYSDKGMPAKTGTGIYARALMDALPLLPVEEEGRLMDPVLRENFVERVFVYHRWQQLLISGLTPAKLIDFHTEHKFSILAHDEVGYRRLGQMVAQAGSDDLTDLAQRYATELMSTLRKRATRKTHTNVLMHVMGYLKSHLDAEDKVELLEILDTYRRGQLPLIVPITLLKHHLRRFPEPYINRQYYLNPHPEELMLRNSL